jgi:hypothetical protein
MKKKILAISLMGLFITLALTSIAIARPAPGFTDPTYPIHKEVIVNVLWGGQIGNGQRLFLIDDIVTPKGQKVEMHVAYASYSVWGPGGAIFKNADLERWVLGSN